MKRRDFLAFVGGGAAAWLLVLRAQQPAMPVIGFLSSASPGESTFVASSHRGLTEAGYVEGENVAIEYRWAEGQYDRLPALASDLVRRQVALIVSTGGTQSARAAKAATATIPVLFISGGDPIQAGLVTSMNRPGGNATGATVLTGVLLPKRLELLRELLPTGATIPALLNPSALGAARPPEAKDLEPATRSAGQRVMVLKASSETDFDAALAAAVQQKAGGLIVSSDPFFTSQRDRLVATAARAAKPPMDPWRPYPRARSLLRHRPNILNPPHKL